MKQLQTEWQLISLQIKGPQFLFKGLAFDTIFQLKHLLKCLSLIRNDFQFRFFSLHLLSG
jgi:hypothetical protein